MKRFIPLGPNLIIKVSTKLEKVGSIYIPETDREHQAQEEAVIVALGESAFDDLEVKPAVGSRIVIARYEGKKLNNGIEQVLHKSDHELRIIQDTRVLAIVEGENDE